MKDQEEILHLFRIVFPKYQKGNQLVALKQAVKWVILGADDRVAKSDGGDVRGTWLQLMCCALPKRLCP